MAGLVPAIHVFGCDKVRVDASRGFFETADGRGNPVSPRARIKSGHDEIGGLRYGLGASQFGSTMSKRI